MMYAKPLVAAPPRPAALPIGLLALYFFYSWSPGGLWIIDLQWFMVAGLAGFIYLMYPGNVTDLKKYGVFWGVEGVSLVGATLSLLNATNPSTALYNTAGAFIGYFSFILLLPLLSLPQCRRALLWTLVVAGIIWCIEIQQRRLSLGEEARNTYFGSGNDKNYIALCLSLMITTLLYVVLWGRLSPLARLGLCLLTIGSIYSLAMTYSRSGLLTCGIGCAVVIARTYLQSPTRTRVGLVIALGMLTVIILFGVLPAFRTRYPEWIKDYNALFELETSRAFTPRRSMIEKAEILIKRNPFLGVGLGGFPETFADVEKGRLNVVAHNNYLTVWTEAGLLAIASLIVWQGMVFKTILQKFQQLDFADRIWLLLFIPYFFMLTFLDQGNYTFFLALFTGILADYQQRSAD